MTSDSSGIEELSSQRTAGPLDVSDSFAWREVLFVCTFLWCCAVLAPIHTEFFPFSTCAMFAAHYKERREYRLIDKSGRALRKETYSIHSNWNWYLERFYGAVYPESIVDPSYAPADMEKLTAHIRTVARREGIEFPLRLEVTTWGAVDTNRVGITARHEYIIKESR